jgi:hypothetical protein
MAYPLAERERTRARYRPLAVRLLLVGEAPPASGRFFYHQDSGLYRAIREGFLTAFPTTPEDRFLEHFQARGCYLVDLCAHPVDQLGRTERIEARRKGEARLARIITRTSPAAMLAVVKAIVPNVENAIERSGWDGDLVSLPYPGRWYRHRLAFEDRFVALLKQRLES